MIDIRPFDSLGRFHNEWLNAHYHLSFAGYRDATRHSWGRLRVWNDDEIQPGTGFERHGHENMEIVTYVRHGAITHKDSLGNEGRTEAGDVQVMSAGSGIEHEEKNLEDITTRLFQIWILPREDGGDPFWQTRKFPKEERAGDLVALASGEAQYPQALPIRQEATVFGATLKTGQKLTHSLREGRCAYLVTTIGQVSVNGKMVGERDGAAIKEEPTLTIDALEDSEFVLVDVPASPA